MMSTSRLPCEIMRKSCLTYVYIMIQPCLSRIWIIFKSCLNDAYHIKPFPNRVPVSFEWCLNHILTLFKPWLFIKNIQTILTSCSNYVYIMFAVVSSYTCAMFLPYLNHVSTVFELNLNHVYGLMNSYFNLV